MSDEVKIPLPGSLQEIIGSLLFASETPLTASELRDAVRAVEPEEGENNEIMDVYRTCTNKEIDAALRGLEKALEVAKVGFKLVCTGGTYRLQTVPSCGRYVRAMLKMDRPSRLGRASLETLAIVAYRQPLTKGEIEEIRGVDVSANIKTLMDLQLIRLVGKSELPGHPFLYGTTPLFLEHFGLASLQQLNDLDPTLQRSNPKKKAEQYRRQEKLELEEAAKEDETPAENGAEEPSEASETSEASDSSETSASSDSSASSESSDSSEASEKPETGEDDFFIDDTPEEFDDEDDDDDEEDDEEDGEEDEDEDDEADGADGAGDDPDRV